MAVWGLWSAVYDRNLGWAGLRLEAGAAAPESGLPAGVPEGKALFVAAELLCDDPALWPGQRLTAILDDAAGSAAFPQLAAAGAQFAGRGAAPALDVFKTRIFDAAALPAEKLLDTLRRDGVRLVAANVNSLDAQRHCMSYGFSLFSFGRMDFPASGAVPQDTSRLPLMRLLSMVAKDAETAEMEEVFKSEPKLAFELLRLVNSTSFAMRTEITSFAQAIMVLGRRQLQRWLQLLLFAHRKDGEESPNLLMQRAAERGRLLELLAQAGNESADREQAFMVGVFSLLDILLATPMADLLKAVSLPQPVEQALLDGGGRLGALLELAGAAESGNSGEVLRLTAALGIAPEEFSRLQLDALSWALQVARLS